MQTIWTNIISGWNFMKLFRVLAGLLVLGSGISEGNLAFILLGIFFLTFSLLSSGVCCTTYQTPRQQRSMTDLNETEYEELGGK